MIKLTKSRKKKGSKSPCSFDIFTVCQVLDWTDTANKLPVDSVEVGKAPRDGRHLAVLTPFSCAPASTNPPITFA